jgi:hypothetical protein
LLQGGNREDFFINKHPKLRILSAKRMRTELKITKVSLNKHITRPL